MLKELHTDLDRAEMLQRIFLVRATSLTKDYDEFGYEDYVYYTELRKYFIGNSSYTDLLPSIVRTNRDLDQFWQYIKVNFSTYADRRIFIYNEFRPLFDHLEGKSFRPLDESTSATLKSFDEEGVHAVWQKALERRKGDPEGAITAARTLLETICKHILDHAGIPYDSNKVELHELYKLTANELNISPSQHSEDVFRQILGGC